MICPQCRSRRARRACPALNTDICAICCGTKRLVEIRCPSGCVWLKSAQTHPPAAVLKQRSVDDRFSRALFREVPERAFGLFVTLQAVIRRFRETAVPPLVDADVVDAASTLAATFETASRGIIYEHHPASLPAQRLAIDLRGALAEMSRKSGRAAGVERDAVPALRLMEQGARAAASQVGTGPTAFLEFLERLAARVDDLKQEGVPPEEPSTAAADEPRIIIP